MPGRLRPRNRSTRSKPARADWWQRGTAIGGLVSVLLVAVGLYLTNSFNRDQYRLQQDSTRQQQDLAIKGQRADRFVKAIDQLGQEGTDKLGIRLGGMYALETLMRDSPDDENTVIEVLSAFIRTHAHRPENIPKQVPASPADVRAALKVLGRRPQPLDHTNIDVSNTLLGLDHMDLGGANLWGADLHSADLTDATLTDATLQNADLTDANLTRAWLDKADLNVANLTGANLTDARLFSVIVHSTYPEGPDPFVIDRTRNVDLIAADLTGANLHGAYLVAADLKVANLHDADLTGADLTDADLTGANLTGTNLHGANLRDAELRCTTMDSRTLLPPAVGPPAPPTGHCPG